MIRTLFTCCTWHLKEIAKTLEKNDFSGLDVQIFAANAYEPDLPKGCCEGVFVMPTIASAEYIGELRNVCEEEGIEVIMPMSSIELELMSRNKALFLEDCVHVSVNDLDALAVANDKVKFYEKFAKYMPVQIVAEKEEDAGLFIRDVDKVCVKINGGCGGKGFAVVDNCKVNEPTMFHAYGHKHYISQEQLYEILRRNNEVIVQRYVDGVDYSVSMLCDHGNVLGSVGYYGYEMEFGAIMQGEIKRNDDAIKIAHEIAGELKLDGPVSFDFMVDKDGVYLLECNPRISASLSFVAEAGYNIVLCEILRQVGCSFPRFREDKIKYGLKMKRYFGSEYYI